MLRFAQHDMSLGCLSIATSLKQTGGVIGTIGGVIELMRGVIGMMRGVIRESDLLNHPIPAPCHPERSEGSLRRPGEMLRFAQHDMSLGCLSIATSLKQTGGVIGMMGGVIELMRGTFHL